MKKKELLIATSGGIDSVVLTNLLNKLNYSFALAHCNFQLRGQESDKDEKFIRDQGSRLNRNVFVTHFDTELYAKNNKISIQMAARDLRYNWFENLLRENKFDYILTAHHADDNLETFLINLIRGTGIDGLTGIPEINKNTIRPLLPFTRIEIETFAKNNKLIWREDKSNAETKYLRNKLRHDIIPDLKKLNSNFMGSFTDTIENLKGSQQIIKDRITNISNEIIDSKNDIIQIHINRIKELDNSKAYLFELLKKYGFTEFNDIIKLLDAQSGKQIYSKSYRLLKDRDFLFLSKITKTKGNQIFEIMENETSFSNFEIQLKLEITTNKSFDNNPVNYICIDKALLKFPLIVRKWKKGDYFYPIGMLGKKKLSKFFKDEKLSLLEKEKLWLLCTSKDEVIWVINKRMDNRFKVTENTTEILKIIV